MSLVSIAAGQSVKMAYVLASSTLLDQLIHYWKLEEAQAVDKVDQLGTWNLGPTNQPPSVTGKNGNAAQFTTGKHLSKTGITQPSIVTVSLWIKHTGSAAWQVIADFGIPLQGSVFLMGMGSGAVVVGKPSGTTGNDIVSSSISSGAWHHLVGMMDTGTNTIKLWIDSVPIGTETYVGAEPSVSAFWVGAGTFNDNNFSGDIDEIGMWDRELLQSEVDELYGGGTGKFYDDF